jgi:hypothetical protein
MGFWPTLSALMARATLSGDGAVSSVCAIVSGTGTLAGASGEIQFVGNFTSNGGTGDYRATISQP